MTKKTAKVRPSVPSTKSTQQQAEPKPVPKRFYLFILILPFLLLLALEGILRLSGFGHTYPLFIPAAGIPGYMQPNPELIKRYFHRPELAPDVSPDTVLFKQVKEPDSFRIVIQGGSTAAGFPFGRFGSPTGQLQTRFKRLYPDKNIEIISTAMASVNTYTLLDTVQEIIAIQPDLVLIYAGHNEYLGVMGVGSIYAGKGGHSVNLLFLKLKDLRLLQLIEWLYYSVNDALNIQSPATEENDARTLMAAVAKEKNIPLNSPLFKAGLIQFENNLGLILQQYQQAKVRVLIGTLAANEADQKPFASAPSLDFTEVNLALHNNALPEAQSLLTELIAQHPDAAEPHFLLANSLRQQGRIALALEHYSAAQDRDLLRFRAPSHFNQIIRQQAALYAATLIDSQAYMRQRNRGLIDNNLMYEHLHPNQHGYFLLAEAFIQQIVNSQLIADKTQDVSLQQAWQDMPLSQVDLLYADYKIKHLLADYPFTSPAVPVSFGEVTTFAEQSALNWVQGQSWLQVQQELLKHYQQTNNLAKAAKTAGILFDALPHQSQIAQLASNLYRDNQDFILAYYHVRRAHELEPDNLSYLLNLAQMLFELQREDEAIIQLKAVLKLEPEHAKAQFYLDQLQNTSSASKL